MQTVQIELAEPVTVTLAPPEVRHWGPYQFPGLSRLPDGRIQVSFHVEADSAAAYGLPPARAVSADDGRTWTMLPRDHAADDVAGSVALPNGDRLKAYHLTSIPLADLVLPATPVAEYTSYGQKRRVYRVEDLPAAGAEGWKMQRLAAGAAQWAEEQAIVRLPGEVRVACVPEGVLWRPWLFPQFVVAPDGALLAVNYTLRRIADGRFQEKCPITILRSTDMGRNWELWSETPYAGDPAADPKAAEREGFTEPYLQFLPDGSALCLLRTTDGSGVGPLYWMRSTDNGRTWTKPAVFDNLGVLPQMLTLKIGVTLAAYGRPGLYVRATSDPAGLAWDARVAVVPPGEYHQDTCSYSALLPLTDDTALIAYSEFNLPGSDDRPCKGIRVRRITTRKASVGGDSTNTKITRTQTKGNMTMNVNRIKNTCSGACGHDGGLSVEDLDRAALAVETRIQEPPLAFSADFENGSLDRVVRLGPDWYHIILRQDTWYRFFFRVSGCAGRELGFEFTCREIHSPGYEEGKGRWYVSNPPIMPLISYDGVNWQPVEHIEKHPQDIGKYRFRHTFSANEAFICHHHPYTYSDMLTWLKTLHGTPGLKIGSLGMTRNGFAEPVLTVTDNAAAKDLVVLIGREDADENTGSWGIEGMVRALLSPSLQDLRSRYIFKIVPMVGIDGVVAGAHHSAGYGYGGHRWHEEPSPKEIQNVKAVMGEWARQGYRLKLAGKVHGCQSFKGGDTLCDGILTASATLRQTVTDRLSAYARSSLQQDWMRYRKDLSIRPQGYFERFVLDEFGLYEVFSTHITGDSPDAARRGGEALMQGLAGYLKD